MAVISISNIGKAYRQERRHAPANPPALQDISLEVATGASLGLLGPNGAGKTTLIKILAGLLRPDCGGGSVLGYDLLRQHHLIRAHVSLVSTTSEVGTDNNLTVRQNLAFWAPVYGLWGNAARARIDELLERLDLTGKADAWPMHISAGQRQRLALARALLGHNPLVFLDEPTNKLDSDGVRSVRSLIAQMNRDEGVTFILTTHVMEEAEELCGSIALLDHGKLIAYQPTRDLTQSLHLARPLDLTLRRPLDDDLPDWATLATLPGVSHVAAPDMATDLLAIHLESYDLRATTPALLDWARQQDLDLVSLRAEPVTLHDAFITLTGKA
jgi:ABC-2 type transport system ATP-binding protein